MRDLTSNFIVAAALAASCAFSSPAFAGSETNVLAVNAEVPSYCVVSIPDSDVSLGYVRFDGGQATTSFSLNVNCSAGLSYRVTGTGSHEASGSGYYELEGPGFSLRYRLYWSNTIDLSKQINRGGQTASDAGAGFAETKTITAVINRDDMNVRPIGHYSDVMTLVIAY